MCPSTWEKAPNLPHDAILSRRFLRRGTACHGNRHRGFACGLGRLSIGLRLHDTSERRTNNGGGFFPHRARLNAHMPPVKKQSSRQSVPEPATQAFDALYQDHVDRIYRYAHRLCGEAESAKDLVQETFLNAYRGLKGFRGEARVSTWLYTIASRACMRMRRKRKGEPEHKLSLDEFIPTSDGELRLQIPINGLTPEEALQNKQLREVLDQAINRLPKKYRITLVLRDMEGLSAKEVGEIMGVNERAVKSRLHRARLFVRKELSARGLGHENLHEQQDRKEPNS